jgi:hypothetical protein
MPSSFEIQVMRAIVQLQKNACETRTARIRDEIRHALVEKRSYGYPSFAQISMTLKRLVDKGCVSFVVARRPHSIYSHRTVETRFYCLTTAGKQFMLQAA